MSAITLTGSCRCGAVTYNLSAPGTPAVYCCHCLDCQKWSGSAFAEQALITENSIHLSGPVLEKEVISRQGGRSIQHVCAVCYSRIYSTNPTRPGIALLRAGTLDTARDLNPRAHIWVKNKQSWFSLPTTTAAFEEGPPAEQFRDLMFSADAARRLVQPCPDGHHDNPGLYL